MMVLQSTVFLLICIFAIAIVLGFYINRSLKKYNFIEWDHNWVNLVDSMLRWFCFRYHRLSRDASLGLPEAGCAVLASNHISGLDALILIAASRRPLRFLIAREEYERFGLKWMFQAAGCIPVERNGRPEKALREALKQLQKGEVIALFPHGKIHLPSDPPRKLKPGVARLAQKSACPIFPVRLHGISGKGYTLLAIPMRSNVHIQCFKPMICKEEDFESEILEKLRIMFEGEADSNSIK